MTAKEKASQWLADDIDQNTRTEIEALMSGSSAALEDAFYKDLEFGTGGMRGVMGSGSNRVNKYTLGKATQGLSNHIKKAFPNETLRVAIAHDSRHNSKSFAKLVADVFSANGIKVFLFSDLRPTPELSFAIRHYNCQSGVVITASHNPPEYNGYKVYWNDGAQIVAPHDKAIVSEVSAIESLSAINFKGDDSLIQWIDKEADEAFLEASLAQRLEHPSTDNLRIAFTSLHGTSITMMPELLKRAGYANVDIVEAQAEPDGSFPTVESPNPEERAALSMALELADEKQSDVVIGTDPDSDRLGVAVRDANGEMILLNGNQCGVLLTDYILSHRDASQPGFIAYTIVSSEMFGDVAKAYNVDHKICLTGFKHIASLIRDFEGKLKFFGGGEESYGYMIGDFVRDKDALTSSLLFCDLAASLKSKGQSVIEHLDALYRQHGLYHEHLVSVTKKGKEGSEEISRMMTNYRNNPPKSLAGESVEEIADIQAGVLRNLTTGNETKLDLLASNVLQFITKNGSKISARPSGTEPKIKFYFSLKATRDTNMALADQQRQLAEKVKEMVSDLGL